MLLLLLSQLTSAYLHHMLPSYFYVKVNEELIFLNEYFQIANCNHFLRLINFLHWFCHGKSGSHANIYVVNGWQSENNRPVVWRAINLLFSKNLIGEGGNCWFSATSLGNSVTYVKQIWCYEVFAIHHDLIYEPFDS